MTAEVLTEPLENARSRSELRRRDLDFVSPWVVRALRKLGILKGASVGDVRKSWDVLQTVDYLEAHLSKSTPVLDIGAYGSEILCVLHKLGFSDLSGIDLNPRVLQMPNAEAIKYVVGDFTRTEFPPETFGAITAISVLEHGFCGPKVLREVSRILKPGGYLVASVDYWPEKIDTSNIRAFGLDWTIFSKSELIALIREAANFGLVAQGELKLEASKPTIKWSQRQYTFAWFVLQKC